MCFGVKYPTLADKLAQLPANWALGNSFTRRREFRTKLFLRLLGKAGSIDVPFASLTGDEFRTELNRAYGISGTGGWYDDRGIYV